MRDKCGKRGGLARVVIVPMHGRRRREKERERAKCRREKRLKRQEGMTRGKAEKRGKEGEKKEGDNEE